MYSITNVLEDLTKNIKYLLTTSTKFVGTNSCEKTLVILAVARAKGLTKMTKVPEILVYALIITIEE